MLTIAVVGQKGGNGPEPSPDFAGGARGLGQGAGVAARSIKDGFYRDFQGLNSESLLADTWAAAGAVAKVDHIGAPRAFVPQHTLSQSGQGAECVCEFAVEG